MKIITVMPLEKGLPASKLSYFTKEEVLPGAVVTVPLKNREIPALVTESRNAAELKLEARSSDFSLKKMVKVIQPSLFRPEFLAAASTTAKFGAASLGQIIRGFSPKIILETPLGQRKRSNPTNQSTEKKPGRLKNECLVIQDKDEERLAFYKSLIRETFAKKNSVFFCLPTIADIERTVESLEKGIGNYTVVLHSRLSSKDILSRWQKAVESEHPILLVATPTFLSLPRRDFSVIIIDRENSAHYKDRVKPFADARVLAEELAKESGAKLILGDIALRTETILRAESGDFVAASSLKYRAFSDAKTELISTKKSKDIEGELHKKGFEILSLQLENALKKSHENNERFFILLGRRGLAPNTVCNDCGETLTCARCGAPLVLHGGEREYYFQCHHCGQIEITDDKCPNCGSWRLAILGLGIDSMQTEIKKRLPKLPIFRVDSDSTKNPAKAKKEVVAFLKSPGSVLLATEMALDYLTEPVENSAVAGCDSLFTLPDFRIGEKIMTLVLRAKALAIKKFFVQTRRPEEKVFTYALSGNLLDFFREEIALRKKLHYPPFTTLIRIIKETKNEDSLKDFHQVAQGLADYQPAVYETVNSKGQRESSILIRQEKRSWPNDFLLKQLLNLPTSYTVVVDPESLV